MYTHTHTHTHMSKVLNILVVYRMEIVKMVSTS